MGGDDITLGEIYRIVLDVQQKVTAQNGKVQQHAIDIAVLRVEQQTLKEDTKALASASGSASGRNWGSAFGAIGGFVGGFVASLLKGGQ